MALALALGCSGEGSSQLDVKNPGPGGWPGTTVEVFTPAPFSARLLLSLQYRSAVRDLLGAEASSAVTPPADATLNGYAAIAASQLMLSASSVAAYEKSAFAAAQAALANVSGRAALVGCTPSGASDAPCMQSFVTRFGKRAFRRPLAPDELTQWVGVGLAAAADYGDFHRGVEFVIAGLLQTPDFLYLIEVGEPDPEDPTRRRLTGHELASRMAFFLTGSPPDDPLLQAAEAGLLSEAASLREQAQALLVRRPTQARVSSRAFFDELLGLVDLPALSKNTTVYPEFTPALATAMAEETRQLLEDVVWTRNADVREAFDAPYTFVNASLGTLYGVASPPTSGFARVELAGPRGGVFGHASFLALYSHQATTSPTLRGKFIREKMLCTTVAAPPDDVSTEIVIDPTVPKTTRERLARHRSDPSCAGCHVLMDDLGLGLENFDALGKYRDTEQGLPIDGSGLLDGSGGFVGPRALGSLLKNDERFIGCLVRNVFRYGVGHVDTLGEAVSLKSVSAAFAASGHRLQDLLVETVVSEAFRYGAGTGVNP